MTCASGNYARRLISHEIAVETMQQELSADIERFVAENPANLKKMARATKPGGPPRDQGEKLWPLPE